MNGAYVLFIDSDDYVSENYLENLYCAAESGDYDIVQGDFKIVTEKNKIHSKYCIKKQICWKLLKSRH